MKKILEGLHQFKMGYFSEHRDLFELLSHGQHPRILFIACSDSRIDPNLITQAQIGELFVIRNAGNIIPPYGAANGGEGASIEYAIAALNIEQVVVCGHSHCGAMKGLLKLDSLAEKMPLVYSWLKHAEATRLLVQDNYADFRGEDLLEVTIAENVLSQLVNLQTYPIIRSRLHQRKLTIHGWIYRIETGEVLAYDGVSHEFLPPMSRLDFPEPEYNLHPSCPLMHQDAFRIPITTQPVPETETETETAPHYSLSGYDHLSEEQAERIYRGSY